MKLAGQKSTLYLWRNRTSPRVQKETQSKMATTVGGYNPLINRYKAQKTDELAQKMESYTQTAAPQANFDIGNMLNGTISTEVGSALEGTANSLFNVGPGYNFDINSIFNKLKSQTVGMIKSYVENSIITSVLQLLAFDDSAATSARVAKGTAQSAANTVKASAVQVKLVTAGVKALMQLAQTGEISQATLSQQLADIVNSGVEAAALVQELTDRGDQIADENKKLIKEAENKQKILEDRYADGEKKFTPQSFEGKSTEELAEMKPEEIFGEDLPEGIENDDDYKALQQIMGQLQLNAQTMVTISSALADNSARMQEVDVAAQSKGQEIQTHTQQQVENLGQEFHNQSGEAVSEQNTTTLNNTKENLKRGGEGFANGAKDGPIAGTQMATGTSMLANPFTAAAGKKLITNAGLNFGASAINTTFGGTMFGNAFKDLVQGKSLNEIILDKLKDTAVQHANQLITDVVPAIENPFAGTIFQDTFASMTNVSGWMQEAATQAIEDPFKKFKKDSEA